MEQKNKKTERLFIRVNDQQKKYIREQAEKENMTISEYVLFRLGCK